MSGGSGTPGQTNLFLLIFDSFDFKKHFFENKYLIKSQYVGQNHLHYMFDSVKVWWKLSVRAGMRWSESLQSIIFNDV